MAFSRRLSVVLVKLKMAETLKEAVTFVEQGRMTLFLVQRLRLRVLRHSSWPGAGAGPGYACHSHSGGLGHLGGQQRH